MAHRVGYLMVDHRASPGLPENVARASGYDPKLSGEGKLFEADTLTCSHCKNTVIKNPLRTRARENCPKCSHHYICDFCAVAMDDPDYSHLPFERVVDITMTLGERGIILGSPRELLMAARKEFV